MGAEDAIRKLAPLVRTRSEGLTKEEGEEIIRAIRRGVTMTAIADVIGGRKRNNLYFALGRWALEYAVLEDPK